MRGRAEHRDSQACRGEEEGKANGGGKDGDDDDLDGELPDPEDADGGEGGDLRQQPVGAVRAAAQPEPHLCNMIRDQRSEIRDQRSEIRDQRSQIRDQRSEISIFKVYLVSPSPSLITTVSLTVLNCLRDLSELFSKKSFSASESCSPSFPRAPITSSFCCTNRIWSSLAT